MTIEDISRIDHRNSLWVMLSRLHNTVANPAICIDKILK